MRAGNENAAQVHQPALPPFYPRRQLSAYLWDQWKRGAPIRSEPWQCVHAKVIDNTQYFLSQPKHAPDFSSKRRYCERAQPEVHFHL